MGINISSMKKYSQSTNKLLTKDLKFDIIKLQKMKEVMTMRILIGAIITISPLIIGLISAIILIKKD